MKKFFLFLLGFLTLAIPQSAFSENLSDQINGQINASARTAEIGDARDPREVIVGGISILLPVVGMIFVVLVVYAGFMYFTAQGDDAKVKKATGTIRMAIIGLAVVLAAYSITYLVGRTIQDSVSESGVNDDGDALRYDEIF